MSLWRLLRVNWQSSVLRRACVLLLLVIPGFILNYGLLLGASRLLQADAFGIFYTGISISNLFFMPAVIIGSFFVFQVAEAAAEGGDEAALRVYRRHLAMTAKWGLGLSLLLVTAFSLFSLAFQATAWLLFIDRKSVV